MGVKIWNTATWKAVHTLPKSSTIYGLSFSPDGAHLATGGGELSSGQVRIWEVGSGKEIQKLEGLTNPAYNLTFSPDGSRLAVATGNFGNSITERAKKKVDPGQVVIFEVLTGAIVSRLSGHKRCIWDVAFSPDGKILASSEGYYGPSTESAEIILWDVATGQELRTLSNQESRIFSINFSPDGKRLATTAGQTSEEKPLPIYLWDVATGREILKLNGHTGTIYDVTFSPNGSRMASASKDGMIRVWDAEEVTPESQTARRAAIVGPEAMERARRNKR